MPGASEPNEPAARVIVLAVPAGRPHDVPEQVLVDAPPDDLEHDVQVEAPISRGHVLDDAGVLLEKALDLARPLGDGGERLVGPLRRPVGVAEVAEELGQGFELVGPHRHGVRGLGEKPA